MKQKCIRCVVQLSLSQLHWVDNDDVSIHLEGAPLFIRACVLGQLQHSHLHKPVFPVCLDQELTFDRVLTNCRNPSLFNEVIRGEHIKIELIQIASDYKGGKILVRFETPAHRFLFPEVPPTKGELQQVELDKSRKYQHPPILTYTCSSTLLETTVQSPVDVIFNESQLDQSSRLNHSPSPSPSSDSDDAEGTSHRLTMSALGPGGGGGRESESSLSRQLFQSEKQKSYRSDMVENHSLSASHRRLSRSQPSLAGTTTTAASVRSRDGYTSAREKLHSLLESFSRPDHDEREREVSPKPVYRVKFKPPVPRFGHGGRVLSPSEQRDELSDRGSRSSRPTTPSYKSPTVGVGPHPWENCPRRSPKRVRSRSLPNSPAPSRTTKVPKPPNSRRERERTTTVPNCIPLDRLEGVHLDGGHPDLTPCMRSQHHSAPNLKPPFVVGHPDPKLISKRNFCGEVGVHAIAVRHVPSTLTPSTGGGAESPLPTTATMATTSGRSEGIYESSDSEELSDLTDSDSDDDNIHQFSHREFLSSSLKGDPLASSPPHTYTGPTANSHDRYLKSVRVPESSRTPPIRRRNTSHSPVPHRSQSKSNPTTPVKSKSLQSSKSIPRKSHGEKRELVSKYLMSEAGNIRRGVASPSKVIVNKIQQLREECCACLHSVDSLGEDDLSEDLERLKASLEAEREETLNKSARFLPDKSVTVQIGPQDYWSRRMSEYTGKRHRVLFDETLEKIYNRLYRDAVNSS